MISVGDTLLLERGGNGEHLWVAIAEVRNYPNFQDRNLLMVNMTGYKDGVDESCILEIGDHPFIKKKTMMYYIDMCLFNSIKLQDDVNKKFIEQRQRVSQAILRKIVDGALNSPHTTPRQKKWLIQQFPTWFSPPAASDGTQFSA